MGVEILVPFFFFAALVAIVFASLYFKLKREQERQKTLQAAIESGQPLPPEILEAFSNNGKKKNDFRTGVILAAVGLGLIVFGFFMQNEVLMGIAFIPLLMGIGFVVIDRLGKKDNGESRPRAE